jgi:osmotically-inducible protein OsmY
MISRYSGMTLALAVAVIAFQAGCNNTAKGVNEDATIDSQKLQQAATKAETSPDVKNAEITIKHDAHNVTAALTVTPKIKTAFYKDKILNDSRNTIHVDTANNMVHLTGTVYSANVRLHATNIAATTLKQMNATEKIKNDLTVAAH